LESLRDNHGRLGRRRFLAGAGGALATAGVAHAATGTALAAGSPSRPKGGHRVLPAPKPIPGGIEFGEFIHVFIPGPEGVVLPFTGTPLMGFNVEPSTITDFRGRVALAYLLGTAQTTDGPQDLEVDVRVMQGHYVAQNGEKRFGTFAEF
jgi:hypothetical protein